MPDWTAQRSAPRYVLALHEASVVAMADGYSQTTDEPTLVNVHTAAGLGDALGAIVSAWHNRAPVIVTAGQQTREMLLLDRSAGGHRCRGSRAALERVATVAPK
jgi:thiamine pyrophosphate-dependent acetolactate synthase large subunit-like protein